MQNTGKLHWKTRLGYGLGDYSLNIFWQGTALFLFYFLTEISGFNPYEAGLLISLSILWDLITDPLTGYFAERIKSRSPYLTLIRFAALPLCISFALLFSMPHIVPPENNSFAICLAALLLFRSFYTLVSIPYASLTIQLTNCTHERNKLAGVRMYCGFLGGLSVIAILSAAQTSFNGPNSFTLAVIICSAIALTVFTVFYRSTKNQLQEIPVSRHHQLPVKQILIALKGNKAALILISMIAGVTFGLSFIMATILHYFDHAVQAPAYAGTAQAGFIGIALIAIPFWSWANGQFGKKRTWVVGTAITCLGLMLLASSTSSWVAVTAYILSGFGSSLFGISIWTMIPDTVEYGEHETGIRLESSIVGIVSAFQKLTIAIASFTLGLMMEWASLPTSGLASPESVGKLKIIVALLPSLTIILSAFIAQFYPAYEDEHQEIANQLSQP